MALLGMGANVQCNGYFPGCYSTRDLIFDSEGNTWTSSTLNDCYSFGSLPASLPCNLKGYNKELLKQTILKHEAIFRDQIHELHRVYHKQRELMHEIKRNELYKHNLGLEASRSNSSLSSKNAQRICCSINLPWSTVQSSGLVAESIKLPLASAQQRSRQICPDPDPAPAPTVTEDSLKDCKLLESKYRKVGKRILDLQLPADDYIDSEEGECLENERVTQVPQVSAYSLNGISQVECHRDDKPRGTNSHSFADLNVPFKLEEEAVAKSYNPGAPTHHRNDPFYHLLRETKLGFQNFPNDVIQNLNRRQDLEACSYNPLSEQEKSHELLSGGQHGGVLDSFAKVIYEEKQSVSVESFSKNLEQLNDLQCFGTSQQINQGPLTKRKFSSCESSARTEVHASNGLLGPSSASHTCALYQLVSGADMVSSGISPAELWKTPVSDFGRSLLTVQASSASFGQNSKSLMGISGYTQDELYQCKSVKSGPNLVGQNFLLSSSFKLLDLPSINTNDPNSSVNHGSSDNHQLRKHVMGSEDVGTSKDLNLNSMPAGYYDTTASRGIQITVAENKIQDSKRGLPWLKEKPVCKGKPNEESVESVVLNPYNAGGIHGLNLKKIKESDSITEKTQGFHGNEKPHMSSDLQSFHAFPSEVFRNLSSNQKVEETEKGCISDVKSPCIHVPDFGDQVPAGDQLKNEEKKHGPFAGIIDLNSCMNEDGSMPMDVDFQAPASPENKECSPPRGESDENQLEMPFQLVEQEDPAVQEEQVKIAAEALVAISGSVAHDGLQMITCSSSESCVSNPLQWFAGIVSTTVDHQENKADLTGNDHEEFLPPSMDYFEFMTLKLTETKDQACGCKSIGQTEQVGGSTQPRKGRTNRGRWRKDFQNEILPSLASLSRYEVTEDLQTIGGLVAAGTRTETNSQRSAGKNVLARGRKRSCTSTSSITDLLLNLKQLTNTTELADEKRGLISWGKTCRKRRGQRFPTTNPQFILSQVYN